MNRKELSFEMGSRLKSLREERHISYQELADALLEKYGIKISKDSLRDYEISSDYRSKAKSLPNLGMRTEYLIALSDFYEVSTDYLLCKTDCPCQDMKIREMCEYTGLTNDTIKLLNMYSKKGKIESSFLARYFEDIVVSDFSTISLACDYILRAANANGASRTQRKGRSISDITDIKNSIANLPDGSIYLPAYEAEWYFIATATDMLTHGVKSIVEELFNELMEDREDESTYPDQKNREWRLLEDEL
ncbi:MAG TPA: helix-turn-helix domain-containing protein [Candidatus Flavonifractor intestinigallinarum]|uniref:Helix-turn-helix domain-containing protein n=1 Tax=Candidatus Flavonifractor intestinigallinarum TaxID=2838586 RepID=A0A9D2MPP0_9FIRM|nr:helix-turn-helix domain-containing protein [Candidatus Flavonifractor intestinigallinarum]